LRVEVFGQLQFYEAQLSYLYPLLAERTPKKEGKSYLVEIYFVNFRRTKNNSLQDNLFILDFFNKAKEIGFVRNCILLILKTPKQSCFATHLDLPVLAVGKSYFFENSLCERSLKSSD